jgi:methanogen homoisocitrate dehydrogenase
VNDLNVVVIRGDGIGPEVIDSALRVVEQVAFLDLAEAHAGLACKRERGEYLPDATLELLREADAALFGAITTPMGDPSYSSPILTMRQELDLYANVRPARRLHPSIGLVDLDMVIIRENTEGMYTRREIEDEDGVTLERRVSRRASERIVRFAISLCRAQGRRRLTCVHKANVLRRSDGLFRDVFYAEMEDSGLEGDDLLVDAAAAALVTRPGDIDCMVTLNLYGDILSDEAAALVGGLGLAPSANLSDSFGLFEPVHGSAPDIAGKGVANPIAAMLSASMMLDHLGKVTEAKRIEEAIRLTLDSGHMTRDLGGDLDTIGFTDRVIDALDQQ